MSRKPLEGIPKDSVSANFPPKFLIPLFLLATRPSP
jgi:hypothetical protein